MENDYIGHIQWIHGGAPVMRKLPEDDLWEIVSPWRYEIGLAYEGVLTFIVRPGYTTDLASVPKLLRGIVDNGSGSLGVMAASQVHDALYATHYMSRELSDVLFRMLLKHYNVPCPSLYYWAVRLFGRRPWERQERRFAELADAREKVSIHWEDC